MNERSVLYICLAVVTIVFIITTAKCSLEDQKIRAQKAQIVEEKK